jgi:hypothetical protein
MAVLRWRRRKLSSMQARKRRVEKRVERGLVVLLPQVGRVMESGEGSREEGRS